MNRSPHAQRYTPKTYGPVMNFWLRMCACDPFEAPVLASADSFCTTAPAPGISFHSNKCCSKARLIRDCFRYGGCVFLVNQHIAFQIENLNSPLSANRSDSDGLRTAPGIQRVTFALSYSPLATNMSRTLLVAAALSFFGSFQWFSSARADRFDGMRHHQTILNDQTGANTPQESAPFRVAVIGAGAAGSSSAWWLHLASERLGSPIEVEVFEQADYIGGRR
jgi:hypothetical protein